MRRELYPVNWPQISLRIRELAGWKCELCEARNGKPHPDTGSMVVLTVAHHPDPNPANCAESNLLALCQRCHNRLDAPMRARHAAQTRARKRAEAARDAGQMQMFD
jgi:5-methylcytosine-specific restriction endonuclease McrA